MKKQILSAFVILGVSSIHAGDASGKTSRFSWYPGGYFISVEVNQPGIQTYTPKEALVRLEAQIAARKNALQMLANPETHEVLGKALGISFSADVGTAIMPLAALVSAYRAKRSILPFMTFARRVSTYTTAVARGSLSAGVATGVGVYNTFGKQLGERSAELLSQDLAEMIEHDETTLKHIKSLKMRGFNEQNVEELTKKFGTGSIFIQGGPINIEIK